MKEKIERFSKGDFEYELPFICLSEEEIRITVEAGKSYEGSFIISNSIGRQMKGYVTSNCQYMELKPASFDAVECTIAYCFDGASLVAGTEVNGEFNIISDCREFTLPFTVQMEEPYYLSSLGKIKDLFQFANLARMDWSEAKKVFKSENFEQVFLAEEERFQVIYKNLLKSISTSQALEEFLISIRKKAAIRLSIDKTQAEYEVTGEGILDKLTLTKNHWGYAEIKVSTDVPFLQLDQKFLWADRFIGNTHQISYSINPSLLGRGNNYGHIYIRTVYQTITVSVLCKYNKINNKAIKNRKKHNLKYDLTDTYLDFRLNRIGLADYIEETKEIQRRLPGPEVSFTKDLLKTHLAIISGKNQLAEELLSDLEKDEVILKDKSIIEYCTFLYLKALYYKDEITVKNTADRIRKLYTNGYKDWRLLWFLLYTDSVYDKNKAKKLSDIKEQFELGCRSPILYYEAVCIFNEEPYLLRELSDFEIQCFHYGIRNYILAKEAAKQYTYQAIKRKTFHKVVFISLVRLYDEFGSIDTLCAICCILIKGMKKSEKYFEWYRLGVEAQLKITELYEYYMCAISREQQDKIAQPVLLYFIYNSSLNDVKKAFLYASVIKNKESNEPVYRSYYKKMEVFALKMLESHNISEDLAILYREFFSSGVFGPKEYKHLPYVLFRHELILNNPAIAGVIVTHKELGTEEIVQLRDNRTQINLYTSSAVIFLFDSFGNRYVDSVEYSIKPYLNAEEYENYCIEYSNHTMLLLHLCDRYENLRILNDASIQVRKRALEIEGLSKDYVTCCLQSLIDYCYENYYDELLENYLDQIDLDKIKANERIRYIEYMLIRGFYKKALTALELYGFDGISVNRLVKLCSGLMKNLDTEKKQDYILNLCYYVFTHGKYDEMVLSYLVKYFAGTTREMFLLWQAAKGFELACHMLEERLLTQMLFAESYIEDSFLVFNTYYKEVTNHLLVRAFLSYYAYRYLVHNQVIAQELFKVMKRELFYEENDICLLAWLKYHAEDGDLSENDYLFAEYNIQRLVRRDIILPFYLQYQNQLSLPDRIIDKLYISYHADPKKQMYIHYRLSGRKNREYITERLPNTFMGIHTKEFILFYHEELQYYITEEAGEETNITESLNINYDCGAPQEEDSNYNHINLMLMSMEMKDEATLLGMFKEYAKREYMISLCFKQIE